MPWGAQTPFRRLALPKPEFLVYPLETNVIDHAVINATGVVADATGPYEGRRYLVQGTILSKRVDNQFERYVGGGGQNVAGILFDTVEFADATDVSDEPVAYLRRNFSAWASKIPDFATYAVAVRAALTTVEFL